MAKEEVRIKALLCLVFLELAAAGSSLQKDIGIQQSEDRSRVLNKDQSSYFANIGPHGFEYHAVLNHDDNPFNLRKHFGSFFNGLPGFQQFPQLNSFPGITEILVKLTPTTPRPIYGEVSPRPTHPPLVHFKPQEELFRRKDVTNQKPIGKNRLLAEEYPKIFKFNDERINIIDFDRDKKYASGQVDLNKGDYLDPDKILREKFLVLHGGVFKVGDSGSVERNEPLSGNRIDFQNLPKSHIQYYYT